MNFVIEPADLNAPAFAALVERHVGFCDATAPAGSCHRLEVKDLDTPSIKIFQVREGADLLGMGGLSAMSERDGEIKSMHVRAEARGKGIARALLHTIINEAEQRGYHALWLETGTHSDFSAARSLYEAEGFNETTPFGDYVLDPHSCFMTKTLTSKEANS